MSLSRITEVHAGDARHIEVAFAVKDERGAIHFHFRIDEEVSPLSDGRLSCAGVETHWAAPPEYMQGKPPSQEHCHFLGAPCWHDGTSLWALEHWLPGFRGFGTKWVWRELERHHAKTFDGGEK